MSKEHSYGRGIYQMILAALSFGMMAVFVKYTTQTLSSVEVVFFRSALGSILIGAMIWKERASWIGKNPRILFLRGLSGFVALMLHFYAIAHLSLGAAVLLNYTAPIFVALLAKTVLKENVSWPTRIAVLVAFVGLYLLAAPEFETEPLPLVAGICSGFFAAIAYILIRFSHVHESPYTIIFYFTAVSTVGCIPFLSFGFKSPDMAEWIGISGVVIGSFFGQIFLTKSIKSCPVSVVMPFAYLTPVFASLAGMFYWQEFLSTQAYAGAIIIIVSNILIYIFRKKPTYIPIEE